MFRPVWQYFPFYSHNRGKVRPGDNRIKRAAWNSEQGKTYVGIKFHGKKKKSIPFAGQKSIGNNWEHFVGACQNAEQMLHQKSKQFTEHWQTRTEEGSLVSTE